MNQATVVDHQEHLATGIPNKKLMIWAFLSSDCMFFGALISNYLLYHGKSLDGPFPKDVFKIPVVTASTFILLLSSLFVLFSIAAIKRQDIIKFRLWTLGTAILGLTFLGIQTYEFTSFFHEGLSLSKNLFGSSFFTLTGTHGLHVAIGVLWLLSWFFYSFGGKMSDKATDVEVTGLYWHFVDLVWLVIFALVYLLEFIG